MRRALAEPHTRLPGAVREPLAPVVGQDLSAIRIHDGPDSARMAGRLGARAFTLGRDIFLGSEAAQLTGDARATLLRHESVHAAQQGVGPVSLGGQLTVGAPGAPAEREAHAIAAAPGSAGPAKISSVAPQIQRDIKGGYPLNEGTFRMDLTTQSNPGAKSGLSGTISFTPNETASESNNIKMLQIVRLEDLSTGTEYNWTGAEAPRNLMQTTANAARGTQGGFFVDHSAAAATPRTARADARVSPYYRSYWPNATESHDGWKLGTNRRSASLWDYPGWSQNCRFSFETVAKDAQHGHVYGAARWGFTISNGATGTVDTEWVTYHNGASSTYFDAVRAFNDYYHNPGSASAPK